MAILGGEHAPRASSPRTAASVLSVGGEPVKLESGDLVPPLFDTWEIDEQLRHIGRLLGVPEPKTEPARIDPPHRQSPHEIAGRRPASPPMPLEAGAPAVAARSPDRTTPVRWLGWFAALCGTVACACGGVLMAWSLYADRRELWTMGLPTAGTGLALFGIGMFVHFVAGRRAKAAQVMPHAGRFELSSGPAGKTRLLDRP
jgi:hypothetical protein